VNFAAQSEVAPSWEHPEHWFLTNVVALTNLANILKDKKYLKKYVHISSPEVYGTCRGVVTEETPVNPTTPYAASKAAGDLSLFTFYKNFGFPLVLVRATNVYGACQQLFKIIPRSMIYMLQGKTIELHGGGVVVKSYIHIRDVSMGELMIMEKGSIGEIYHLSPDQGIKVKDVIHLICHKMGKAFETSVKSVGERLGQDQAYIIDSTKARTQLGWNCSIPFNKGIGQTLDWIENNYEEIIKHPLNYIHKE
jgi:dTDP-glucose 4,6-dehydratase